MSCLELELNGAAGRARVTEATVAGLVVLNSPGSLGSAVHRNITAETEPVKSFGALFSQTPLAPFKSFSSTTSANPVLQLRRGDLGHDAPLFCNTFL